MHMGSWCSSLSTHKWRRRSVLCFEVVGRPPAAATTSCTLHIQPLPNLQLPPALSPTYAALLSCSGTFSGVVTLFLAGPCRQTCGRAGMSMHEPHRIAAATAGAAAGAKNRVRKASSCQPTRQAKQGRAGTAWRAHLAAGNLCGNLCLSATLRLCQAGQGGQKLSVAHAARALYSSTGREGVCKLSIQQAVWCVGQPGQQALPCTVARPTDANTHPSWAVPSRPPCWPTESRR